MPSFRQIRAARALLGWEIIELAKRTGLNRRTLYNIETDRTKPQDGSIDCIQKCLCDAGVEFIDHDGVRMRSDDIETFIGAERFHDFTEFVYAYLDKNGGEVCVNAVDETLFQKYRRDMALYKKRMQELVARGDVTVRILASTSTFKSDWAQYRHEPANHATPTAFYAFGSCLALISFAHEPAPYVVLHRSGPFADAYRAAFEIAWKNAKRPPR
jgi:transcriptional regulator with XRE-family HTH domain